MAKFVLSLCIFLLAFPATSAAQDESLLLAQALHRMKTGESGRVGWRECGNRLTAPEASQRAQEYAALLLAERDLDPAFDPWIGGAIAMVESSLNRCAVSREARMAFEVYLGHEASERDILRLLRSPSYRAQTGVGPFSAGLVQFRWPGAVAALVGLTDAGELVDGRASIRMLAASMQRYRRVCDTITTFDGTYTVNRRGGGTLALRYSVPCSEGYWVQHNSPSRFNYRYYRHVMYWYNQLRVFGAEARVDEETSS